jgi:hypothetical protein
LSGRATNYLLNEFEIQNNQSFLEQQRCEIFVETNLKNKILPSLYYEQQRCEIFVEINLKNKTRGAEHRNIKFAI